KKAQVFTTAKKHLFGFLLFYKFSYKINNTLVHRFKVLSSIFHIVCCYNRCCCGYDRTSSTNMVSL
ncbi:unnamed protein product, partial [Arabidopsis halleri]